MKYTLNQIKARLETFAAAHLQVKGNISFGEIEEVTNQAIECFPYMFCIVQPSNFSGHQIEFSITIVVMDLVAKDLSNRWDVWSDTAQILSDIRAYMNDPAFDDLYIMPDDLPITPFAERFTDDVTGWSGDFKFRIVDVKDRCALPI